VSSHVAIGRPRLGMRQVATSLPGSLRIPFDAPSLSQLEVKAHRVDDVQPVAHLGRRRMRGIIAVLALVGVMTGCGGVEAEATEPDVQTDDSGDKSAQVIYCTSCTLANYRCMTAARGDPEKEAVCSDTLLDCLAICI